MTWVTLFEPYYPPCAMHSSVFMKIEHVYSLSTIIYTGEFQSPYQHSLNDLKSYQLHIQMSSHVSINTKIIMYLEKQRTVGEIKKDFCGISELFGSNLEIKHLKYV